MFPKVTPNQTKAWQQLQEHYTTDMKKLHMRSLFAADPGRFGKYSLGLDGILFDYSKNIVSDKTLELLRPLPKTLMDAMVKPTGEHKRAAKPVHRGKMPVARGKKKAAAAAA